MTVPNNNLNLSALTAEQLMAELKSRSLKKDADRKVYKELVNTCIADTCATLKTVSGMLSNTKYNIFKNLKILLDMKLEVYELKEDQQTHTFSDTLGNTITYGYRVVDGWDDTASAGIEKINEFIQSLIQDNNSAKLVTAINRLLKRDAKGNLKASRVLELTKMAEEFDDAIFADGVNILSKAYKPVRSCFFIDAYFTDEQGNKVNIPLSISSVDFPKEVNISELFPINEK